MNQLSADEWLAKEAGVLPPKCPLCEVIHSGNCPKFVWIAGLLEAFASQRTAELQAEVEHQKANYRELKREAEAELARLREAQGRVVEALRKTKKWLSAKAITSGISRVEDEILREAESLLASLAGEKP